MTQNVNHINSESSIIRALIEEFIQGRLQEKLNKVKEPEVIEKIKQIYKTENWIADAARRASQIQLATHSIKFQNPDARGSNIYLQPIIHSVKEKTFVSTHTILDRQVDAVGNAAALDVFKFLQLSHDNETLLSRALKNDPELLKALPGLPEQKIEWLTAFAGIARPQIKPATHTLAKQIYFPLSENQYHIIAPLFPTSLVQTVFEEVTKNTKKTNEENVSHSKSRQKYINLAVQKFGGSKPQNISFLNKERKGNCYLLPSFPPIWKSCVIKPPLKSKSILRQFFYQVHDTVKELRKLLANTKINNYEIRQMREDLTVNICDQLLFFAGRIQQLPSGWSADPNCKLSTAQMLWLDPGRKKSDIHWNEQTKHYENIWKKEVSHDFAIWLNQILKTKKLPFAADEYKEWKALLNRELSMLKEVI